MKKIPEKPVDGNSKLKNQKNENERIKRLLQTKAEKRKKQKNKWFNKNKETVFESRRNVRSTQRENKIVFGVAERKRLQRQREQERKNNEKNRKQKERINKINELQRIKRRLQQKRDYQSRVRSNNKELLPIVETPCVIPSFSNKMSKHRAVKKLRNSLPKSPGKRVSTVAAYVRSTKSPTIHKLKIINLIKTPEGNLKKSLGEAILEDLKSTVSATKLKRSDDARATMNIITASVSGETVKNMRSKVSLAKTLGVPVRRISSGLSLRTKILHTQSSSYLYTKRKVRSDALSDEHRKLIHDFWSSPETSHPTGNKNDIKRVRIGPNTYSSHPVQILEKSQSEVFSDFRLKYPDIKVSQSLFERCKPYFVRQASKKDRMTCCCRYHLEMKHVFKSTMNYRKELNKSLSQEDQLTVYETIFDLCNSTLCEPDESGYHSKKCVDRECDTYGLQLIQFSNRELDTTDVANDVNWQCFEYVTIKSKTGPRKKLMLVKKKTKPGIMIQYFQNLLKTFPAHNLRAKWQAQQLKQLVRNLPSNDVVAIHDYSENYRCKDKTEIQSSYFQKTEVSIHVTLLHRHSILEIDGVDSTSDEPQIITEQFFVISDDDKHDQYFTFQVQKFIAEYLSSISYNVDTMHEFCDGCTANTKVGTVLVIYCNLVVS